MRMEGAHLDHDILLEVVLESLQLQLQHWREGVKQDALLGILQTHMHNSAPGSLTSSDSCCA